MLTFFLFGWGWGWVRFSLVADVNKQNSKHLAELEGEERTFEAEDDLKGIVDKIVRKKATFGDLRGLLDGADTYVHFFLDHSSNKI